MATITRGKTFGATEEVTNTKLHQLVDSATISGITSGDISGSAGQLVIIQGSAPSSPSSGWLWYDTTNSLLRLYDGSSWKVVSRGYEYTNQSGGSLAAGDVVVLDTSNATSVTTTTTANDSDAFGVVIVGGAAAAAVQVITEGYVPLVTLDGAASIGDFLFTDTVAKQGTPSATFGTGAFGRALSASSTPPAIVGTGLTANVSGSRITSHNAAGTFTRTIDSTGTQLIAHGCTGIPSRMRFFGTVTGRANAKSIGECTYDGSTFEQQLIVDNESGGDSSIYVGSCVGAASTNSTQHFDGAVTAVDATNITITWSSTGSTAAGTLTFSVLCDL